MARVRDIRSMPVALLAAAILAGPAAAAAAASPVGQAIAGAPGESTSSTTSTTTSDSSSATETTTSSQTSTVEPPPQSTETSSTETATTGASTTTTTTTTAGAAPSVSSRSAQRPSSGVTGSGTRTRTRSTTTSSSSSRTAARRRPHSGLAPAPEGFGAGQQAPLPFTLRAPISGVPALFIETLDVPPFLLPIYQAAGIAYDVPWEVLAAINEVETDYGNDLAISSAGAEGWMQFMPEEWSRYGVDIAGSGWMDPYNPADAIFAAARYLQAAGGSGHIRAAVFAYNHSQAYVEAVMLRAKLLERMPPDLLGAVTNLAEARFPVHAPAHFADGFASAPAGSGTNATLVGTTIYSEAEAPVIAVKDGTVAAIGQSPSLGRYVTLRDADGNRYTYAQLGSVASLYPSLTPRGQLDSQARQVNAGPKPTGAASSGTQTRSPVSEGAVTEGFALGAGGPLQGGRPSPAAATSPAAIRRRRPVVRSFGAGAESVQLRELRPGVRVIAGTVLGRLEGGASPHMLFQIRPAGLGAPLIDPKPVLDAWVQLEDTGVFAAKGENPFLATSPTSGQALFESAGALGQQLLRDRSIGLEPCERQAIRQGRASRPALASIELLALSSLHPTVAHLGCDVAAEGGLGGYRDGRSYDITAIDGRSIGGHIGPGGVADAAERKLMTLQGTLEPSEIAGPIEYPGAARAVALPASRELIHVSFSPAQPGHAAKAASVDAADELTAEDWLALTERLASIPDVSIATQRSAAAIPDATPEAGAEAEGARP